MLHQSLFLVRGDSMSPALRDGDLALLAPGRPFIRDRSRRGGYGRGSVVVARMPAWGEAGGVRNSSFRIVVKRVVGRPGEYVRVGSDGAVSINDARLREPYLAAGAAAAGGPGLSWLCGDDEYFLMGDNRGDSADGRRFGPTPARDIIGRVWLKLPTHLLAGRRRRDDA